MGKTYIPITEANKKNIYNCRGITEPSWNMTVKVDSDVRFHDSAASKAGETYCYLDSYRIEKDSLEFKTKTSKFNVFSF